MTQGPLTEDAVFRLICDGREQFHHDGPAKSMAELWQRKTAQRIMALIESDPRWSDSVARATKALGELVDGETIKSKGD